MFEQASRLKLRFESSKGQLTVENLWDLPLQSKSSSAVDLDSLARAVSQELKGCSEESFVSESENPKVGILTLKLEILKHVIKVKKTAENDARTAILKREQRKQLESILASKQEAALANLSVEEIQKRLNELS